MSHDNTPQMPPPPLVTPPQTPQPPKKKNPETPAADAVLPTIASVCRNAIQADPHVTETELLILVLEAGHEDVPRLADTVRRTALRIDPTRKARATTDETAAGPAADPAGEAALESLSRKWSPVRRRLWMRALAHLAISLGIGTVAGFEYWLLNVPTGLAASIGFPEEYVGPMALVLGAGVAWLTSDRLTRRR
ncbi:hypothetical protein OV450_1421 [Actinobacteria bacterium OV450]|nr:hypothetical protein OV450_1421 [Actinobacteria bacterium OV450]